MGESKVSLRLPKVGENPGLKNASYYTVKKPNRCSEGARDHRYTLFCRLAEVSSLGPVL